MIAKSLSDMFIVNGEKYTDKVKIAHGFCSFFTDIGKQYAEAMPRPSHIWVMHLIHHVHHVFDSNRTSLEGGGVLTYMFSIGMCCGKDPPFLT